MSVILKIMRLIKAVRSIKIIILVLLAMVYCPSEAFSVSDLGPKKNLFKIDSIKIRGIKKVEREAILEKISSKKGMVLDNYILRKDIQKIYKMKYFEFVEAHQETKGGKNHLVFVVREKPIVVKIIMKGNNDVDNDDLISQLKTKEFSILDINTVMIDVGVLQKFYEEKGYYLASIKYEVKKITKENVELVFNINEYEKVKIKKIIFLGNLAFSDKQLKDIMETREESLFSFMTSSGSFKEFNFQTDIERIKYFYKTKGYLQVNLGTPQITVSEDKRWVFISIKLNEGPMFSVNEITFQGEVLFPDNELLEKISLKKDEVYSEEKYQKDVRLLTEMYQDKGYAFANVLRMLRPVPGENRVDVEFSFEKGKIASFGKITIKGNTKTRDKVVRRELRIREGARFNGTDLRKSKDNVNRLGFFEPNSIIFNTISVQGKDDVLDVEITVKERNTGQISLGAGYSTATKAFMQASIAQTNFLGRGQNLSFSTNISNKSRSYNLGFTEPYFLDSKWTAGGDIFKSNSSVSSAYSYGRKGFDTRVGYPIYEYTRLFVTYKFEDTTIKTVRDTNIDIETENGVASGVRTTIVRDTRNNRMEPSGGYYLSLSGEYTGLGGDKKWLKTEFDARYFHKVWGDLVFRSRFFTAKLDRINGQEIPRTEKFTLGGARNLRGYYYEAIGPKEKSEDSKGVIRPFNVGGLHTVYSTLELEHPLAREAGLKWVLFFDIGNVYEKHIGEGDTYLMYADYGLGFRWFSPIGVLRFEFGFPLGDRENQGRQFYFDIGQLF